VGVAVATNGDFALRLTKATSLVKPAGWHYHPDGLQVFYVLRGWFDLAIEGGQIVRIAAGTSLTIPSGFVHNEVAFSDDLELLEYASPSEVTLVFVDAP
jgi:quercetin dioxygenase-like cupin family protein